jgi:hypothetical protein
MLDSDSAITAAIAAHEQGRYPDALALLQQLFAAAQAQREPGHSPYFMAMFGLQQLLPVYRPAHTAVQAMRDAQVTQLLAGSPHFGAPFSADYPVSKERFSVIVELNDLLGDTQSTCALFADLDARDPAVADRHASRALPALVAEGAWALANRYRGEPLRWVDEVNELARTFPLLPPPGGAPRLGAMLSSVVRDVHLGAAVLEGLGDAEGAAALRAALLDGIDAAPLRALAQRELAAPGTITNEIVAHQMTQLP